MDKDSALFLSIPPSTVRAARALYGSGNIYLRLGDQLNRLAAKFDRRNLSMYLGGSREALLSLMTIIQYVEKMTDRELTEAIHLRMDLRYALHLATPSPRIEPQSLCAFRSRILSNPPCRHLFEEAFKTIYPELTTTAVKEEPNIDDVLSSICENEVRGSLMEAMLNAMEALSANHFNWLRAIAMPHWYQRYSRSFSFGSRDGSIRKPEVTREDILGDIQHLLYEIRESNLSDIMEMPETKNLNLLWAQLNDAKSVNDCNHCIHSIQ
jgi:hypothetical protein